MGAWPVTLGNGNTTAWHSRDQFVGYNGAADAPSAPSAAPPWLARRDRIDRAHPIGHDDPAGVADVILEAAVTTIIDLEDSSPPSTPQDKVAAYRNWLGLMTGQI